jgi:hypothetical protein
VLLINAIDRLALQVLLDRYGLSLQLVAPGEVIPGSYWGEREAGLMGAKIFARLDTPVHSVLHEGAHFICMTPERRAGLDTDATCKSSWPNRCRTSAANECAATWTSGATRSGWEVPQNGLIRMPRTRVTG